MQVTEQGWFEGESDNAYAESFLHSLKAELTRGVVFPTARGLGSQLTQYIRDSNTIRLHSRLAYLSPLAFGQRLA